MKLFGYELLIHHGVSFSFSILNFVSFLTNDQTKAENYIKVGIKLDWDNMKASLLCLLWCIWRERNAHCFEGKELPLMKLKFLFLKMLYEWMSAFISFSIQICFNSWILWLFLCILAMYYSCIPFFVLFQ